MISLTSIIRQTVPRSIRNAIRRPSVLLLRIASKVRWHLGSYSELQLFERFVVRCHPLCETEFSIFLTDQEQSDELKCFIDHTSNGMKFLDVGSHWGIFTLTALHFGGSSARCIDIEASKDAAYMLNINLQLNSHVSNVEIVNAACGDKVGQLQMLTTGAGGADYFVVPTEPRPDTTAVKQVTVDYVCAEHAFFPTHIKIDVEGYEEEVLMGAMETIPKHRPLIFLELHGNHIKSRGKTPETVLDQLEQMGYVQWCSVDGSPLSRATIANLNYCVRILALPPLL